MFYDRAGRRVMVATPDGTLSQHPFIQPDEGVSRIDWNISHDEQTIAWTETSGDPSALTTTTWVAGIDGVGRAPGLHGRTARRHSRLPGRLQPG